MVTIAELVLSLLFAFPSCTCLIVVCVVLIVVYVTISCGDLDRLVVG